MNWAAATTSPPSSLRGPARMMPTAALTAQLFEQSLGVFEVRRVEAFAEPTIDFCQHPACLGSISLGDKQAREAHRRAELPRFRAKPLCECERPAEVAFGHFCLPQFEPQCTAQSEHLW